MQKKITLLLILACLAIWYHPVHAKPEDFAANLTNYIQQKMQEHHVPGLTIAVIKENRIVYKKGFGYADVEKKQAVDPDTTLFRMGSISKLFTWTAAMQLHERGQLDLNTDLNQYLKDYQIPTSNDASQPITMQHLMAHTPGFSARMIDLFTYEVERRKSLADVIKINPPVRLREPGQFSAYSNYGSSLAGFTVEQISNTIFENYIKENLFSPLGMQSSTFVQPIESELQQQQAFAYLWDAAGQRHKRKPFEIVQGTPAGGLSASAVDVARFLIANMNQGRSQSGQAILKPETVKQMHQTHFKLHPEANGFAHGFFEMDMAGVRILGHGGDTMFFHSVALIAPEKKIGLVISTNGDTGRFMVYEMARKFIYDYIVPPIQSAENQDSKTNALSFDVSEYTGFYQMSLRPENEPTKTMLLGGLGVIPGEKESTLIIPDILKGAGVECVMIAPDIFQATNGYEKFVFLRDDDGNVYGFINNFFAGHTFLRPPIHEHPFLHLPLLIWCMIILLIASIMAPTGIIGLYKNWSNINLRPAHIISVFTSLAYFSFFGSLLFGAGGEDAIDFIFEPLPVLPFWIPYLALAGTVGMLYVSVEAYLMQWWTRFKRLFYAIASLSYLLFFWLLWFWELTA